jgi:hypothetical protein
MSLRSRVKKRERYRTHNIALHIVRIEMNQA